MSYTVSPTATVVDTSASSSSSAAGGSGLTKDAASITGNYSTFLNLLTAQIKNQDPLSPMDTTQWTNQLVQYSSVEQQLKANQYLAQIAAGAGADMSSAVNFIGKTVSADTKTATLNNGAATWNYNLGSTASKVTLTVKDKNGDVVWSGAGDPSKGTHSFAWDGKTASGNQLNSGDYTLSLDATDGLGNAIDSAIAVSGVVTSAQNSNGTVTLTVGGTQVPLSDITGVANTTTASN